MRLHTLEEAASPIKLFWDGYGLLHPASGVYQSACSLFEQLTQLGVHPRIISPLPLAPPFADTGLVSRTPLLPTTIQTLKPVWPMLSQQVLLRQDRHKSKRRPMILHGLSNINLPVIGRKRGHWRWVITVHDTIPLIEGTGVSARLAWQVKQLLPKVVARADAIVTVSHWTKHCLIERFPACAHKIRVIPNGFVALRSDEILPKWRSNTIRVLTVSRAESYKRLDRLITLFRLYPSKLNMSLVTDHNGLAFIQKLAPDVIESGNFRVYVHAEPALLTALYRNADVYLHPSLYEGFCMPAAEALACATPVVYQCGSGIDEVVGQQVGVGLQPGAPPDEWLNAIETAFTRSQKTEWPLLVQHHLSAQASWKQSAEALKSLYTDLINA